MGNRDDACQLSACLLPDGAVVRLVNDTLGRTCATCVLADHQRASTLYLYADLWQLPPRAAKQFKTQVLDHRAPGSRLNQPLVIGARQLLKLVVQRVDPCRWQ